jgi:hypothetical protein
VVEAQRGRFSGGKKGRSSQLQLNMVLLSEGQRVYVYIGTGRYVHSFVFI